MNHRLHEMEAKAIEGVQNKLRQGREMMSAGLHDAQTKLNNAQEILLEYAKQHPFHAIGLSFLAGMALSQLFSNRND